MSSYPPTSPYYLTKTVNKEYLDIMVDTPVPKAATDTYWTITQTYHLRPDLLAYDLYSDSRLWWVFSQRNPNKLKDPLFDFTAGTAIYLPQLPVLKAALGI